MNAEDRKVTIHVVYEASGICAQAVLHDIDRPQLVGTGRVVHGPEDPFPPREELAVIHALRDLTNRLVARERTAHLYLGDLDGNSASGMAA
jgi:hypothetical protein